MAKQKQSASESANETRPDVIEAVIERAKDLGVSPETAEDIVREAAAEGVDPDKLQEVAEEAIQVEKDDLDEDSAGDAEK